jgi:16S rRNA (guanine1207-N2)-methyltransferase
MTKPEREEFERRPRGQYFDKNDSPAISEHAFFFEFNGHRFVFETGAGVFSKERIDTGSRVMLQEFCKHETPKEGSRMLDLGCGYGFIGIVLAAMYENTHVDFVEINGKAAKFAVLNARTNGLADARVHQIDFTDASERTNVFGEEKFNYILVNPPVRAGKQIMDLMIAGAKDLLDDDGGILYIVVKTSLGAKSWQDTFERFEDVHLEVFRESGYRVFKLVKLNR